MGCNHRRKRRTRIYSVSEMITVKRYNRRRGDALDPTLTNQSWAQAAAGLSRDVIVRGSSPGLKSEQSGVFSGHMEG